jgi:hypothetical protein
LNEAHVRDVMRVLCRIPIHRGQQVLYHLLLHAGGGWVASDTIRNALGYQSAQHRGMMSSLAGRINTTPRECEQHHRPGNDFVMETHWTGEQQRYRARPELIEAIQRLSAVKARAEMPLAKILETGDPVSASLPATVVATPPLAPLPTPKKQLASPFGHVLQVLSDQGLHYSSELIANLLLALQTKQFVILTGISGTGKTRIAQAIAHKYRVTGRVTEVDELGDYATRTVAHEAVLDNYQVVAVRPDWTDSRGLLGYHNPITETYRTTPFLRLLLRAHEEVLAAAVEHRAPAPFFCVLDEMNLARVEHYFADFLSVLESGERMWLHDIDALELGADEESGAIPKSIRVPPNLFFIGTVNVDESTYMFSPKVLDRAFTIELNEVHLATFGGAPEWSNELNLSRWNGELPTNGRRPATKDWVEFAQLAGGAVREQLVSLHTILATYNRHFGYRVANEIARFVNLATEQAEDAEQAAWTALDLAILQKVLVKLSGTEQELGPTLDELQQFALNALHPTVAQRRDTERWAFDSPRRTLTFDGDNQALEPDYPRSALKLWRMRRRLRERGFASWVE